MIGGIIGDLAASTYLLDSDTFYRQLIGDRATLSEYGLAVYAAVNPSHHNSDRACAGSPGQLLMLLAVAGWYDSDDPAAPAVGGLPADGETGLAMQLMPEMIRCLRGGLSKDETYTRLGDGFRAFRHSHSWRQDTSALSLMMRAWNCFYRSFDFGSALHNAVKEMPDNPRLMASLTGMMASAMYGHAIYYIKRKYSPGDTFVDCKPIRIPDRITGDFADEHRAIAVQMKWQNVFYKKNNSLTNVERHRFTATSSRYEGMEITAETRRRILRSFPTDWENRFGFYLDDGHIYVYRSHYLLGRFRIMATDGGAYTITRVQKSDELPEQMLSVDNCIGCAMRSAEEEGSYRPYRYRYNINCKENPYCETGDLDRSRFWECERMFADTQACEWYRWIERAREAVATVGDPDLAARIKSAGPETAAIYCYIRDLYTRLCPGTSLDWLRSY